MKVWVVLSGDDYEPSDIRGIFTTFNKAETFLTLLKATDEFRRDNYEIIEVLLDCERKEFW